MNTALSEVLKEAYTLTPSNVAELSTIVIDHPDAPDGPIYLVRDLRDWDLTVPGEGVKTFEAAGFRFTLPASGNDGLQELNLAIDNTDERIGEFLNAVKESTIQTTVTYRPYLSTDPTTPQMDPPLILTLRDVDVKNGVVTAKASFADLLNKPFPHPSQTYTRERFPSLGNL